MQVIFARLRTEAGRFARSIWLRIHEQTRPAVAKTVRLTFAAVVAYIVAKWAYPNVDPLLAPLTALLVTQLTLSSIVYNGFDRVVSVVAGVLLALGFSALVGLTWWSLGLLIAASLIIGMLLRVGPNLIEVPISAMLVLGVGVTKTGPAAYERIIETLIGAGVGMAVNILVPPGVRVKRAGEGVERFADEIALTLENAAEDLEEPVSKEQASAWLARARNFSNWTPGLDGALVHAEESRRLNVRAINSPDIGHALRGGLDALEHSSVAVRSLFRSINDVVHFPDDLEDTPEHAYPQSSRVMTALVMLEMAKVVREFGSLVHAQIHTPAGASTAVLAQALESLARVRAEARELFKSDRIDQPLVHELNVFVVATAGRFIREFELSQHTWMYSPPAAEVKYIPVVVTRLVARRDSVTKPWKRRAS